MHGIGNLIDMGADRSINRIQTIGERNPD